jgi:hypothetical protein
MFLAVNFSLIMPDVITEVLSSLFTGKAINELFTGSDFLINHFSLLYPPYLTFLRIPVLQIMGVML